MAPQISTIVRPVLRPRRALALLSETAAPALGGLVARKLWFTIRHADPIAPRTDGQPFELAERDYRLRGYIYGDGPTVLLVHGWGGNQGHMHSFIDPLRDAGYRVITVDLPAHGESTAGAFNPTTTIAEMADAITATVVHFGGVHGVIAHSGGASALGFAMRQKLRVDRAVLIGPMAAPTRYLDQFAEMFGFGPRIMKEFVRNTERYVGVPFDDFDLTTLPPIQAPDATLVIHDRRDRETSWSDGADIAAAWPRTRLHSTDGLGHRRILSAVEAVTEAVEFMTAGDRPSYEQPRELRQPRG